MAKTRVSENEEKGRFGADYVRQVIENGWRGFVQEFQGPNDRGIDFIVQDVRHSELTSLQFEIQVKTSDFNKKFPGPTFPAPVDQKHIELWRDCNVPVVLVCVDVGPPPTAFWRLISPRENLTRIEMSKRNVLDVGSRDGVIAEIRRAKPQRFPAVWGEVLRFPLQRNKNIKDAAKDHYRQLMQKPYLDCSTGPIEFTWKGWRHMTRKGRSLWKIRSSLLLLPSIKAILNGAIYPAKWRAIEPVNRGNWDQYRTLLVFERVVRFDHRVPTWVQVVIEALATIPKDWAMSVPYDPRRKLQYKFLNLSELSRPVSATDLSD